MKTNRTELTKEMILAALILVGSSLQSLAETIKLTDSQIGSIDRTDRTLTVNRSAQEGPLTIYITSQTQLFKNGEPATSAELEVGDVVRGSARRFSDGKIEAVRIYARKAEN